MRERTDRMFLSKEEGDRLIELWWKNGDRQALERLLKSCFPMVYKLAGKYSGYKLSHDDLVSEGMLGLAKAAAPGHYNPDKNTKFQTYALNWSNWLMLKFIKTNYRTIVSMGHSPRECKLFWNFRKIINQLEKEGMEPTNQAIADRLKIPEKVVRRQLPVLFGGDVPLESSIRTRGFYNDTGEEGVLKSFSKALIDPSFSPEEQVAEKESIEDWKRSVAKALNTLDARDKFIVKMRNFRREPLTLRDVGNHLGLSRERVRQLEERALAKIRKYLETRCGLSADNIPDFSSPYFETGEDEDEISGLRQKSKVKNAA